MLMVVLGALGGDGLIYENTGGRSRRRRLPCSSESVGGGGRTVAVVYTTMVPVVTRGEELRIVEAVFQVA